MLVHRAQHNTHDARHVVRQHNTRLMEQGRSSYATAIAQHESIIHAPTLWEVIMAMKTIKTQDQEVSVANATFVAFSNVAGVYPDVLVWEHTESGWAPVAWRSSPDSAEEVSSEELELEIATRDSGAVLLGEDCTRQQFYEFVFGTDVFSDSEFKEFNSAELGFESDVWYPAQMQEPGFLMSDNDYLVEYHEGLDWSKAEGEVRKDLDKQNEHVHEEMYGHSYRA